MFYKLDSVLKCRDITLPTKVYIVKAVVFPVAMYVGENWTVKREGWAPRNWCFQTVGLEKILESPLDSKEIKPVNPKGNIHWKDWCWRSNTLATWCEELTHWKRPWCWERLRAGGEGDDRGWDGWMASLTQRPWVGVNSGSWWWTGRPGVLRFMGSQSRTQLSDWTDWLTEVPKI